MTKLKKLIDSACPNMWKPQTSCHQQSRLINFLCMSPPGNIIGLTITTPLLSAQNRDCQDSEVGYTCSPLSHSHTCAHPHIVTYTPTHSHTTHPQSHTYPHTVTHTHTHSHSLFLFQVQLPHHFNTSVSLDNGTPGPVYVVT